MLQKNLEMESSYIVLLDAAPMLLNEHSFSLFQVCFVILGFLISELLTYTLY